VKQGELIPTDLIVYADRGDLENAGYKVKENGIPICHSHLGLKNKTGVAGMIANPVILGKLMHEIVQNHLLNKKHFKHKEYVEEVIKKQMAETEAQLQGIAKRFKELLVASAEMGEGEEVLKLQMAETEAQLQGIAKRLKELLVISAEMGEGKVVTPEAQELCYTHDDARHMVNKQRYGTAYTDPLLDSGQTHLTRLARGVNAAIHSIDCALAQVGEGHDGYKVADFNVDQSVDDALKKFGPANPAHAQQVVQKQVVIGSNGQPISLKNPYEHASQEFLRYHLLKDFEGTMARKEDVDEGSKKLVKAVSAFNAAIKATKDKAAKAALAAAKDEARALRVRLQEVNAAATGAILNHIRPGRYKRHGEMAGLHEEALSILSDTHSAQLPSRKKGSPPPPALTKEQAELDRAKAKVAYHVMKHLADDVHFEMPSKKRQRTQTQIDADKDKRITAATTLLNDYKKAYQQMQKTGDPQPIIDLAAKLDPPDPLPKKKKTP